MFDSRGETAYPSSLGARLINLALQIVAVLCVLCAVSVESVAARLFTSGCETNDLSSTEWSGQGGSLVETSPVHSGTYSCEAQTVGGNNQIGRNLASNITSGTIYWRFYVRFSTFPSVDECEVAFVRNGGGSSRAFDVYIDTTGGEFVGIKNRVPATPTTALSSVDLATNTWYRIETQLVISDTTGSITLRLYEGESTTVLDTLSLTGQDTLPTNINQFWLGSLANATYDMNYDDVALNDATGSFQNTWPGPGKVFLVKPASNDTVGWTRTGANCSGTTNTDCVDDEPGTPDDLSGYNTIGTSGTADRLNKTALGAEIPSDADLILIDVYGRFGASGSTGTRLCRVDLWDENGTQTSGPDFQTGCDASADTWAILTTADHLVFDLGTRSKATVDDADFDIGYTNRSAHNNRVTALWANVEWKDAPPPAQAGMPARIVEWQ
jgi:hypothetical protein